MRLGVWRPECSPRTSEVRTGLCSSPCLRSVTSGVTAPHHRSVVKPNPLFHWKRRGTGKVSFEEVNAWKPGRKLAFAYRSDTGPVLLDLQTGHTLPVVSGWSKHPLDEYLEKLDAIRKSAAEMVTAQTDTAALWKKEMTRAYNDLKSRSKPTQTKRLETAQSRWEQFKEAEVAFLRSLNDEDAGTIGTVVAASRVTELYRRRAFELAGR